MRSKADIKELLDTLLTEASGYEARATYKFQSEIATRFAENAITQNMGGQQEKVTLTLARDKHCGTAVTNRLNDESLKELVKRAADVCANSPVDPEYMPPLGPQTYPATHQTHFNNVAKITPIDLATEIKKAVQIAAAAKYQASGLMKAQDNSEVKANSAGLFAESQWTNLSFSTTMHGPAGSGHGGITGESAEQVDVAAAAQRALDNAIAAQNPVDIEPGDYTVVFEPEAVWDLLMFLNFNLDARNAEEGVTPLAGCVGKKIFADSVNLSYLIDDPDLPTIPFGDEGMANRRIDWVREGVLEHLYHDRYWAAEKGIEPDPGFFPLYMTGENRSIDDLIAGCKNGLLVKRLWYVRYVDLRELLLTGMTRDGLFKIIDGQVTGPVKNLRFNESPITFLNNIEALSQAKRISSWIDGKVPGVRSREFTFSSKTESV